MERTDPNLRSSPPESPRENAPNAPAQDIASAGASRLFWRCLRFIAFTLVALTILVLLIWSTLALYYAGLTNGRPPRTIAAGGFAILCIALLIFARPREIGLVAFALAFLGVLGWYFTIRPSNDRDWAPDVAEVPYAVFDGDRVTIHNIRNFDYRSETDFTPRYDTRTFDLGKLRSVDFVLSFWGSPLIAHTIICFGFDDGQFLDISIETRKERGESYSAVQGFFRQYELIYVIADERDVIRLRTNYRNEDVYLFRTNTPPDRARVLLVDYLKSANELRDHPEFYNALTTNCTTSMLPHLKASNPAARLRWELLLNGYSARLAYDNGNLDTRIPYQQLFERSHINATARSADQDPGFSTKIRENLPRPEPRK